MFRFIVNSSGRLMKMLSGESSFCFKDALKRCARSFIKITCYTLVLVSVADTDRPLTYLLNRDGISNVGDYRKDEKQAQGSE